MEPNNPQKNGPMTDRSPFGLNSDQLEELWMMGEVEADEASAKDSQGRGTPSDAPKIHPLVGALSEGPGSSVGPYKLLQQIGEGGFGVVYMADQKHPVKRRVALKIIKTGMDTKQVIGRFEAERQALALMDHPNIAKVLDAGATERGRPYFVMELVKGIPITQYCDHNKLSTAERLHLFMQVCRAIQHAHQKGIIHRDIKPSNIMVTLHDGVPVPKVIDFGIAKATQQELTEKTLFTQYGQLIGTPTYTSPEQAEMSGLDVDTRSDIYSLGVLLYELLTGKTPLEPTALRTAGYDEIRRRIREEEPARPSTRISTLAGAELTAISKQRQVDPSKLQGLLRGDLDWIVVQCLEKDRTRRYETASGLALDIQRHLNSEPVTAVAPSPIYTFRKFARRNKLAFGAASAVLMALVVGFGLSLNFYGRERVAREESEERRVEAVSAKSEAQQQARRAVQSELAARQASYEAEMNVAQQAVEAGNITRATEMLQRHVPQPGQPDLRGFEWRYLWGQTHRELWTLQSETDAICSLAVSPDGRLLATVDRTGMVRFWDMASRREIYQTWAGGKNYIWLDFSPDGETLAIANNYGGVILWDVRTRRERERLEGLPIGGLQSIRFAPDGATLAMGYHDGTLRVRHLQTGETTTVKEHAWQIKSISISADSRTMVTAGRDGRVQVWEYPECRIRHTHKAETLTTYLADISPNGAWMATVRRDIPSVTIWDARTLEKLTELAFPINQKSSCLRFSPDSQTLALGIKTGPLMLYDTQTWQEVTRYYPRGPHVNTIAFSLTEEVLLTSDDHGAITAWDARPGFHLGILKGHPWGVTSLMYSPDGSTIAAGSGDGSVTLWDAQSKSQLFQTPKSDMPSKIIPVEHGDSDFFAFSPDSQRIAVSITTNREHRVLQWDIASRQFVKEIKHPARIMSLAYSPDGLHLATGTRDYPGGTIRFWSVATQQAVGPTIHDIGPVESMAYSEDGQRLATEGSAAGAEGFRVWDVTTGERVSSLIGHSEAVGGNQTLVFSPDGRILATAGSDRKVILWDSESWRPVTTLFGHVGAVSDLAFSPDGTRLASASRDGMARLWSLETGQVVASFAGTCVDFAPNGATLAVGGSSGIPFGKSLASRSVRLYRTPTLAEIDAAEEMERQRRTWIDPGVVNQWLFLGPLDASTGESLTPERFAPEGDLSPHANRAVQISGQTLTWQPIKQRHHSFDFVKLLGYHEHKLVVGACFIESERDLRDLQLLVGSDNDSILCLNGIEVYQNNTNQGFRRDQDRVTGVHLNQGMNRLVFKVVNQTHLWAGSVRFTDSQGNPVPGIRVTLSPGD
jgi:eukaryotic-like serine/threonine-protein kinase